ncbi:selenocysteine-specific translation elongation factor [Campylobacter sp. RM9344]|uniref:Selenocysteine-specific elongation factor n=1 Tax=Campylobacter californiensis TaxID=1032243 RepID=A0AAW3ZVT9_9BACT|nr:MULTISPECIES: selenocysteine-specific translation elongation factor [unclassified Campylobacter]MBE2984057.1 selenocysteine-specific translation elongation factor [Campylobacter sp. RM6883]MBE2987117.1 selenocysteine-specific translation elongation factor [Campylobacter sp. RM12919]MBE2988378.1 selenocysteine-specific translation elongation factor [Campylobacter sp. RM12920]MBE2995482.1 selenocysteine-specific translation elongation factor [Campylobacter sp. RM6913]MBE3029826.1 selenocystei
MSVIIGTAGHIDHGKTALIKALNGFEGDRMKQEKERGITIDLSFSNLKRGDENIAFIDVPGHENLVKTMISGAFGFDACLLVVAANDGIMPQTKEHINVLNLLGVNSIVVAISKSDLVSRTELLEREHEIHEYIAGFKNLQILEVFHTSIKDENSINELRNYLFNIKPKIRPADGVFRYYIDRVFSIKGVGSVVTGSVIEGSVHKNEKVFNYDFGKELTVRSVQVHDSFVESAQASNRVALNLTGAELSELKKGQLLSKKGFFRGFLEVDAVVFSESLSHNENVTFCVGSKQCAAKALILSKENGSIFATFKFDKEMFLKFNEPFVLIANARVIGGGRVLNPISEPMKKQGKVLFLNALNKFDFKTAFEILKDTHKNGFGIISAFQRFGLTHEEAINIAKSLKNAFVDEAMLNIYDISAIERVKGFTKFILEKNQFAIFSPASISLKLGWASEKLVVTALNELEEARLITKNDGVYTKTGVDLSELKVRLEDEIYKILDSAKLAPDAPYNIYDELEVDRVSGDNALKKLTSQGRVTRLAHNLFVTTKALEEAEVKLRDIIKEQGLVNVQNAKDRLGLSRKYIIAYLEHLDRSNDIIKDGMNRMLKS